MPSPMAGHRYWASVRAPAEYLQYMFLLVVVVVVV
jgi:hypothetical protein